MKTRVDGTLHEYLRAAAEEIERELERAFSPVPGAPELLHSAQRYTLLAGGKRLRGVTVLACTEMLRGSRRAALPFAAAVEMVHASSLILDDLPSMDDAALRRGKPTLHRVEGEAQAILAAVGLLNRAYALIAGNERLRAETRGEAARRLSLAVGDEGLIAGQIADLLATAVEGTLDELEYIHRHKTGALFIAAAELGALAAEGDARHLAPIRDYAKNLGLAFQITDDVLDATGDARLTGKDVGLDRQKRTFVDVCGVAGCHRLVDELIDIAQESLLPFGRRAATLQELAEMVRRRDR